MSAHAHRGSVGLTGSALPSGYDGRHYHRTPKGDTTLDIPLRRGGHTHAFCGEWLGPEEVSEIPGTETQHCEVTSPAAPDGPTSKVEDGRERGSK